MPGHVILAVEAASLSASNPSPMAAQLRDGSYDVLVTSNVSEAVGLIFVSRRIEAVLINSYGEPMTGVEMAARLRAINPRIPILVVEADPGSQSSEPQSEKSICFAMAKLEQFWQEHDQKESRGSQSGEFSCLSEKGDIVLASGEDAMKR